MTIRIPILVVWLAAALPSSGMAAAPAETMDAFDRYSRAVEDRIGADRSTPGFLRLAGSSGVRTRLLKGEVVVVPARSIGLQANVAIPSGQINHWLGAGFVPHLTIATCLSRLQDYNNRKLYMQPDMIDSRLLHREGDEFTVYLRIVETSIISGVFDLNLQIGYRKVGESSIEIDSRSRSIVEVASSSAPIGSVAPDHGLLWRLNHYWRFTEADGGIYVECEGLILSRSVPAPIRWLASGYINRAARNTMSKTVSDTMQLMTATRMAGN